ncbi:MAG: cation diffusion facilitator family transporter [Candidatus Levyibacteriota bacterium]
MADAARNADHDHEAGHGRGHGHSHAHDLPGNGRAFAIGVTLNLGFVVVELVYGLVANSLALLADAGHNFGDVLGLLLAWGAATLATRSPSRKFTYGLRGTTILAALGNAMLLLLAVGAVAWEAIRRMSEPAAVEGGVVIWVALTGVVVNTATAVLFMRDRKKDLNIRGAYLHMAADAAVSLAVVVAGIAMLYTGWLWLDPVVSLAISVVILLGTWGLLRESVGLALHAVPEGVDAEAVHRFLAELPGVSEVHDLHIWGMSTTDTALTAHLVMPGGHPGDEFLADAAQALEQRFAIGHATVQIETATAAAPCALAPAHVV